MFFIPLRAERFYRRFVWLVYVLIAINFAVHFVSFAAPTKTVLLGDETPLMVAEVNSLHYYAGFLTTRDGLLSPQVVSSMFLHGGWAHLLFNMLFLFVFGCAVEDLVGWWRFLLIYFVSGWLGTAAFVVTASSGTALLIGASGAISGILGAHLVLLPRNRITVLWIVPYPLYIRLLTMPAWLVVGVWVAGQILFMLILGTEGGVAYAAHLGGIAAGAVLALLIRRLLPFEPRATATFDGFDYPTHLNRGLQNREPRV
ncbi:MAG: rhomboid family intramembrane serine protease [Planctomycetota bacterium]|nr:MAG: rhomboid family intramembrane serine protease [Planctomycetota bacterium]